MKKIILAGLVLLAAACGDKDTYTWGDAYTTIATEFCNFAAACSYTGKTAEDKEKWTQDCINHSVYHTCELGDSVCDVSLADGAEAAVDTCVEAMHQPEYAESCIFAFYGVLPEECNGVWEFEPMPEE